MKGEGRPFWNGEGVMLTLSWVEGVMLTNIKVFIILFLLEGIGNILEISKVNQLALLSIECPDTFSSGPN